MTHQLTKHAHTFTTQSRIGYLTIPKLSRSKQYGSLVKVTSYNLPVSSINLCTASKTFLLVEMPVLLTHTTNRIIREMSVIVSCLILFIIIFLAW